MRLRALLIASFLIAASVSADPPARVVRLNLTDGVVSFRPAGIDEWTDAVVNRPLIDGDELWTDSAARAEMHIGSAAVRLAPFTSFGIYSHTDGLVQLRLTSGTMNIRVRRVAADDVWEIDTPNASVSLLRPGRYRVDVAEDGFTTFVTARGGEAEVAAGGSAFVVRTGEQAEITGDSDARHEISAAPRPDDFDRWCSGRDQREEQIAALRYIPRDLVGYEDLDDYGEWRLMADYGWGWRPTHVAVGWAPYRHGHWAWVEPWGWTWIDDNRWGFAPFHYGRWAHVRGQWFWIPGKITRPIYAPALVAFGEGHGAGWHAGMMVWWALAPGEIYMPAYAAAPAYVRNINAPVVNITNINITNINVTKIDYRNQHVAGGVTAIPHEAFVGAKPVAAATVSVSAAQAMSLKAIGTTAPVAPRSTSVLGHAPLSTPAVHPPQGVVTRTVIARTPPPLPPIPFKTKQEALTQTPGKALTAATQEQLRSTKGVPATTGAVVQPLLQAPKEQSPTRRTVTTTPPPGTTAQSATAPPPTTTSQTTTTPTPPRRIPPARIPPVTTTTPPTTTTTAAPPPTAATTIPQTTTTSTTTRRKTVIRPPVTTTTPTTTTAQPTTTNPPPRRLPPARIPPVTTTTTTTTTTTAATTTATTTDKSTAERKRKAKPPEKENEKKKDQR